MFRCDGDVMESLDFGVVFDGKVVTSAVTSTFSLTHPPSFRHGRSLVRRADRRVNASGVAGASSFPTTPGDVTSRSPANKARQGRGRRGGAPRAAAFCPERGSAIASRRGVPVPGPVGVRLVPRGRSPAPRPTGADLRSSEAARGRRASPYFMWSTTTRHYSATHSGRDPERF